MDYKKLRKIVISKKWPDGESKSGDEYRSLSGQIDTFIDHLIKQDSPLNWIPFETFTEEETADFVCVFLDRGNENRKILDNLSKNKYINDFGRLVVSHPMEEKYLNIEEYLDSEESKAFF